MPKGSIVFDLDISKFNIILNYLYRLYSNQIDSKEIQALEMLSISSSKTDLTETASFYYNKKLDLYTTASYVIIVKITWHYNNFYFTFKHHNEQKDRFTIVDYVTMGLYQQYDDDRGDEFDHYALYEKLVNESFSLFKDNCESLRYRPRTDRFNIDDLEIIKPSNLNNKELLLTDNLNFQINQIKVNISVSNTPIRILVYGESGTGKSNLIDDIIETVQCNLLTLKVYGEKIDLEGLYSFVKVFDRILLIVDDIEKLLSDTSKSKIQQFWEFIELFESKENNKIFIIISTTNKEILKSAALLPNRINSIIRLEHIPSEYYKTLIKRETDSKDILALFSDDLLNQMHSMNLTAPFIINFINHLKTELKLGNELNSNTVEKILQMLYYSFYSYSRNIIK